MHLKFELSEKCMKCEIKHVLMYLLNFIIKFLYIIIRILFCTNPKLKPYSHINFPYNIKVNHIASWIGIREESLISNVKKDTIICWIAFLSQETFYISE